MTEKKKLGRPPAVGVARDRKLEVRVAAFELAALVEQARREGVTLTDYVRSRVLVEAVPR
jgi:predicted HicB family RNase H-like nuclease